MSNKCVILDLDDTLGDMKSHMHRIIGYYNCGVGCPSTWHDFAVEKRLGISWEQLQTHVIEEDVLSRIQPHNGAAEFTKKVKQLGLDVMIMTARQWHPNAEKITSDWLDRNGFHYNHLKVVPISACKSDVILSCKTASNSVLFLDDRVEHCTAVLNKTNVSKVLLYKQAWNASSDINRVDNYEDVLNILRNSYEHSNSREEVEVTT